MSFLTEGRNWAQRQGMEGKDYIQGNTNWIPWHLSLAVDFSKGKKKKEDKEKKRKYFHLADLILWIRAFFQSSSCASIQSWGPHHKQQVPHQLSKQAAGAWGTPRWCHEKDLLPLPPPHQPPSSHSCLSHHCKTLWKQHSSSASPSLGCMRIWGTLAVVTAVRETKF